MKLQKIGGYGSLVNAFVIIVLIVISQFVLNLHGGDFSDPIKAFDKISTLLNPFLILLSALLLSGIAYVAMVLALRERMQDSAPNIMRTAVIGVAIICALWFASAFIGIIGMPMIVASKDAPAFWAVFTILLALATAGDFSLGCVLLLIGWAALKSRSLPRMLSYLFLLKGIVMALEIAIALLMPVGIFLGLIFYPWLGIVLLRSKD